MQLILTNVTSLRCCLAMVVTLKADAVRITVFSQYFQVNVVPSLSHVSVMS